MAEVSHLSAEMRRFYRRVVRDYALREHHERLLIAAAEAFDRKEAARALLAKEGLTVRSRFGEIRSHPAAAIERDSAIRFARLIRELGLSDEIAGDAVRPPRLRGRYASRD